jgi:hypothetical protein
MFGAKLVNLWKPTKFGRPVGVPLGLGRRSSRSSVVFPGRFGVPDCQRIPFGVAVRVISGCS